MFDTNLLAVDGSDHALHAARVAARLANALNSKTLRAVVAYAHIPAYLGEPDLQDTINARRAESQQILQKAGEAMGSVSAEVYTDPIEGDAAESIIEVARTHESDVIVMGSRRQGRLAGMLWGSTSQKVVAHAPCPVLIVR